MNDFNYLALDSQVQAWSQSNRQGRGVADLRDPKQLSLDAIFFDRELVNVLPTLYEARRPTTSARNWLPIISGVDPDDDFVIAQSISWVGDVGVGRVGWKGGIDTPIVQAGVGETFWPIRAYKQGVQFEDRVLRKTRSAGRPLDTLAMARAMDNLRRRENSLLWSGDSAHTGVYGVFNSPDVGTTNLPSAAPWDDASTDGADILADLLFMRDYIVDNTNYVYDQPPTILLPSRAYRIAASMKLADGQDTTVLQFFLNNSGGLVAQVAPVNELNTIKKALVYIRDPQLLGNLMVADVRQYEPQRYVAGWSIDMELVTGGFVVIDANAIRAFDQILT